jgi:hypothetical protein
MLSIVTLSRKLSDIASKRKIKNNVEGKGWIDFRQMSYTRDSTFHDMKGEILAFRSAPETNERQSR